MLSSCLKASRLSSSLAQEVSPACSFPLSFRGRPLPSWFRDLITGFVGRELLLLLLDKFPSVNFITTDIVTPPQLTDDKIRLKVVKADLSDKAQVKALFEGEEIGAVYALQ
jgi:hypothetical protein